MQKKSVSKLKKDLDLWFSLFIRLRNATLEGVCQCFTCGKIGYYKTMQNSHFQSRKHLSTRFNEENCQVGCVKCNVFNYGEQYKFSVALDNKYGEGTAKDLELLAKQTIKISRSDYEEKITYYKEVVKKLKKQKNIE
jgi:5-methylcytosine-specific restriction endonuclease McrA|tara:strand:+ start:752 stop:1162 length:411 start_codon:yes stop_codon:yes gene_type:complete